MEWNISSKHMLYHFKCNTANATSEAEIVYTFRAPDVTPDFVVSLYL